MKEVSEVTALVYDHGLFLPLAVSLSRKFKRVLYYTPFEKGFSTINDACIGDGFPEIERCNDPWKAKADVDLFIFPDVEHSGLQLELESQGYPVWGSRDGDTLELLREKFHGVLDRVGLDVPTFHPCVGVTELREFLKANDSPFYIKLSRYRGSFETKKFRSWAEDENLIDLWAVRFGPFREQVRFLVFDPIETELEIGGDTWCINGQWPNLMLRGDEAKDKAYLSVVTPREEMPEQLQNVMDVFGPELGEYRYKNFWSMEVRVQGERAYFGDATCRSPMPATGAQLEIWENLPEVIWQGANGGMTDPVAEAKFAGEVILEASGEQGAWVTAMFPEELRRWLKLSDCCEVDGATCFPPPDEHSHAEQLGWLVATGESVEEVIEALRERIDLLPSGVSADLEPMAELLKEVRAAEAQGIEFSGERVPSPASVIE